MSIVITPGAIALLSERAIADAEQLLIDEYREPLGHEPWREATAIEDSEPRSALMIGVAALEVGVKEWIAREAPDTTWLLEESPSPPAIQLLDAYVPTLLRNHGTLASRAKRLPKPVLESLEWGVKNRNKVAHVGARVIPAEDLRELLSSVRDALYLLDYFSGHDWAIDRLRDSTRTRLRPPKELPVSQAAQ